MTRYLFSVLLLFAAISTFAQNPTFQGTSLKTGGDFTALSDQFFNWQVYQIDAQAFDHYVKNAGSDVGFGLQLGDEHDWQVHIEPRDIRSADYSVQIGSDDGVETIKASSENLTYRGHLQMPDGGTVALTVDHNFIYGYFELGNETYFIEPLWYFVPGQAEDRFVVYAASDVKPTDKKCGLDEMMKYIENPPVEENHQGHKHGNDPQKMMMGCREIELAIASDYSMFQKYGSIGGVQNHNIGVINNVQTNYDNEFNDELQFVIVTQFVVSTSGGDPWTSSTNAATLLNSFTSWGPGGFGVTHDLGELWTNRNLNGGTVGIAWLNAVCTFSRYHVLQDFTSNSSLLRVMVAHEIGHNFSATHDSGSGFIMSPTVNNTNTWSNQSLNQINNYYPTRACLANCASSQPPVANFTVSPGEGCAPLTVTYMDQSAGATGWQWTFPGGVPATSNQQNPTVTYNLQGSYGATLIASNSVGSNTITQQNVVVVDDAPIAAYSFTLAGLTIVFENNSTPNADSYFWQFGDGNTSTEENPIHTYDTDGFYDVTLTATNDCGQNSITLTLPAFTAPSAGFVANPTEGCAELEVEFTDGSSANVIGWEWEFEGGTPATSTEQHPTVTYSTPGVYSVTLTVSNPTGTDTKTETDFITVGTTPSPSFTYTVDGSTVTFTNTTDNSAGIGTVSYLWDFGDNNTSTEENPEHTYTGNGDFTVILNATNDCGTADAEQTITIVVPPTAGFSANETSGCEPFTVQFNNTSSANATEFDWDFPGGDPSSSTEENPTVTYNAQGTYDVTLTVTNSAGSNSITFEDYITVAPLPSPAFTSSVNGLTATFTNTSANTNSYHWDFGDNQTSTETNPVHAYEEDGTYTVTLTATNDCGGVVTTQTVVIVTPPTAGFSADVTSGCAPLTVQFMNQSSENSTSFQWDFPGGDPSSSTAENPTVTYDNPGSYTVTLTVTNPAGNNSSTQTNYIVVTTTPTAGFNSATNNATVNFTNTSTGATSYSWDFGDNNSSTESDPEHTYAEDGEYTVVLTATNDCGSVTTEETITIVTPPTAGFSASQTTGCEPLTVQFTNESSENSTSWEWEFPGGNPSSSTEESPTVTYSTAGSYTVTLTAINSAGQSTVTEVNYVVVTTVPAASFTVSTNVFIANFTNTTTNGMSYEWDFGDGSPTSTEENPTHEYGSDGTYTVTLTATNDCGTSAAYTMDVEITSLPQAGFSANSTNGCAPFTVQFMDESSSNAENWEWEFPGGNPSSSTEQNPTVTYENPGTYTVTLTVSNGLGENTLTQTDYITVGTGPMAGFTSTTNMLVANFANTSSGATSYEWDFGDNQTSTEADPQHTYDEDGIYTVTLTATNDCGTETFTQQVTVVSLPTAGFSADVTTGCAPFTVQFTNESSENATNFEWEFPGGDPATSTDENPSVTYSEAGVYTVTLTASNAAGEDVATEMDYIVVGDVPTASFFFDVNELTATFDNNSSNPTNSGPVSYEWDFGDGSPISNEENPVHTYAEDGSYPVTLTVANDCGSAVINGQVTVVGVPTANFSAAQTSGCAPFEVQFSNESSANATDFEWEFPGGTPSSSTEENPIVTYSSSGTYDVILTVTNSAGSDTYTLTEYITVDAAPSTNFDASVTGNTATFTNNSTNATSYEWDFGNNMTSNEIDPMHTYAEDGAYTVTLTATNDCGSTTYEQIVVIATMGPIAAFTTKNTTGCLPFEVTFENLSSANAESFEWEFPGGEPATSTAENPTVAYDAPGTYDVILTATNPLGSDTYTEIGYITVNDVPTAGFTAADDLGTVTFTNTSTGATSYEWDFGDNTPVSNEESPVHTYAENGQYEVILTATNDCGSETFTEVISVTVSSVGELTGITAFNVYPNPNTGQFTMTLQGEGRPELEIYFTNVLGQVILNQMVDFRSGQLTQEFNFDDLAAGMYIFQVRSGDRALHRKVIVD